VTVATPRYFPAKGIDFVAGRPYAEGRSEVVLNEQAASMFGENVTVGDTLNLTRAANGESLASEVVGIVRESSGSRQSFLGGSGGPAVYAPTDPFYERTIPSPTARGDEKVYSRLLVTATDVQVIEEVQGRVFAHLTEESDARILKPEGYQFEVTTYDQLVDQIREVSNTFTAYISGIALVSLVVGAIGIANIMLVSVTERTREIGIMKAVGATRGDILQIFLAEAVILGALGSILGTLLGLAGGFVGTSLIFLPLRFEIQWAVVAVLVGVLVGVAAGLYPAWNAARIDPIDALRHE
jgi:putative ABC transport system permease protein